ncbi:hypothetical protein DdX_22123 [Ditylenchus destructor]|uniref:Uncharacterized protein n=1 Tax=Ditylenchus destructor TaxID=166010 RepID=A0AAD4MET5_9BILA|nr:hypothetical protein DdX_22123 [Ditylenchus destructor]
MSIETALSERRSRRTSGSMEVSRRIGAGRVLPHGGCGRQGARDRDGIRVLAKYAQADVRNGEELLRAPVHQMGAFVGGANLEVMPEAEGKKAVTALGLLRRNLQQVVLPKLVIRRELSQCALLATRLPAARFARRNHHTLGIRRPQSMVVSHSCSGFISPRPL